MIKLYTQESNYKQESKHAAESILNFTMELLKHKECHFFWISVNLQVRVSQNKFEFVIKNRKIIELHHCIYFLEGGGIPKVFNISKPLLGFSTPW